jgi:cytoskeleton protein RodZ
VKAAVASPEPEPKSELVTNVTAAAAQATPQNAPVITDPSLSGGQGGPVPLPMVIPGTAGMPATASVPAVTSAAPVPELLFSALNTSWIEVRGSQNQLLWNGVLNTGDSKRLQAPQPVSVVVGRADAIQVSFKGQPLDLIPHTKVNVARFEVKP